MTTNQTHQGRKLQEYLRGKGFDLKELAPKLGIKRQYFYTKYFLQDVLDKEFLEKVTLVTGFVIGSDTDFNGGANMGNIVYVPIHVQAGFLTDYKDVVFEDQLQHYSIPGVHGRYYDLEVRDLSMFDMISPGDRVYGTKIESFKELLIGGLYMVQDVEGMILKIFHSMDEKNATFVSYNKDYPDFKRPLKSIKSIYRVDYCFSDIKRKNFLHRLMVKSLEDSRDDVEDIKDKLLEKFLRERGIDDKQIKSIINP